MSNGEAEEVAMRAESTRGMAVFMVDGKFENETKLVAVSGLEWTPDRWVGMSISAVRLEWTAFDSKG